MVISIIVCNFAELNTKAMKKIIIMALTVMCSYLNCNAQNGQNIIINGDEVEGKDVTTMTFDGDDVRIVFSDNSTETVNMEWVKIFFNNGTTNIGEMKTAVFNYHGAVEEYLTLSGIPEMTGITIYDTVGKQKTQVRANNEVTSIYVGNLAKGIYTAKAGKFVIKFIKK